MTRAEVFDWLREVKDPELPAADVVGLGIVRDVVIEGESVSVVVTPTFSGCPALRTIEEDVARCLEAHGVVSPRIRLELAPAWSTDEIDAATRESLAASGIAPPPALRRAGDPARCPRCGGESSLVSPFGSTPCKALWRCSDCGEPFDAIKSH